VVDRSKVDVICPPIYFVEEVSGVDESNHDDVINANDLRATIHKGQFPAWLAGG
jgi:hypothetical protein